MAVVGSDEILHPRWGGGVEVVAANEVRMQLVPACIRDISRMMGGFGGDRAVGPWLLSSAGSHSERGNGRRR